MEKVGNWTTIRGDELGLGFGSASGLMGGREVEKRMQATIILCFTDILQGLGSRVLREER